MSNITATFKTRTAAESTLQQLENIGVTDKQISLIMTDETRGNSFNIEENSKLAEGTATGATVGGVVGAVIGALSTATALAIPGLNIIVAGSIVSVLAGLGAGATAGGFVGALVGAGIPEHEAKIYEDEIKNGSVLISVEPKNDDQRESIKNIFEREDAYHLAA